MPVVLLGLSAIAVAVAVGVGHADTPVVSAPENSAQDRFDAAAARLDAAAARLDAAAAQMRQGGAGAGKSSGEKPPFPPATPEAVIRVAHDVGLAVVRIDVAQEVYVNGKRTLTAGDRVGGHLRSVGSRADQFSRRRSRRPSCT